MNVYYSLLGRIIDERTAIDKPGYYVLCEEGDVKYCLEAPKETDIVTKDEFLDALVEGCRTVINDFATTPDNENVYAFNLYADEHNSFYIYINTDDRFRRTLQQYQENYPDRYQDWNAINSLKYNQGDFDFQFWQEHMGKHGETISRFEEMAYLVQDLEDGHVEEQVLGGKFAFEAGIIKGGYYALALKAIQRLIEEQAFSTLHTSSDFIAFAATGNDYLDYSLLMRKTIPAEQFYVLFPDLKQKDQLFDSLMKNTNTMNVGEFLDYWMDTVHDRNNVGMLFEFDKFEYDVFLQLERYGNELADECLSRLGKFDMEADFVLEDYEKITYYIEALHFAGRLADEQKEECLRIAKMMKASGDDNLNESIKELISIVLA